MPIQKDLKRRVRARMRKTGESYTAARAKLLERKRPEKERTAPRPAPKADLAELAGMSDAAVRAKTGRDWAGWVAELDRAGAAAKPHRDIARLLRAQHDLPGWWSQMVTVGYERIRGLREKGQRRGGGYDVNKSKTYPVALPDLWLAFTRCKPWLGDAGVRMSKATKHRSMRWKWPDGSPIDVHFWPKGPAKTQVQLQHGQIASRAEAERLRTFWGERLGRVGELLAAGR